MGLVNDERNKWNSKALQWDPTLDPYLNKKRRQARPSRRWTDEISDFQKHQMLASPPQQESNTEEARRDKEERARLGWIDIAKNKEL